MSRATAKVRVKQSSPASRKPKPNLLTADKSAENPNHREDFESLLSKAVKPSRIVE
jgi:hypothetical protein